MKELKDYTDVWAEQGLRALKVKIKSLAAEAAIIRAEERKITSHTVQWQSVRQNLRTHRIVDVRSEARAALLAYALIRGKPYHLVERPQSTPVDTKNVQRLVDKFGPRGLSVIDWLLKSQFKAA